LFNALFDEFNVKTQVFHPKWKKRLLGNQVS